MSDPRSLPRAPALCRHRGPTAGRAGPARGRCDNRSGWRRRIRFGRPLGTLRVSVTDRCNLRCAYCMPETEYVWLPRADLLTFEEIDRLVAIFVVARRGTRAPHRRRAAAPPRPRRPRGAGSPARPASSERALTTNGVYLAAQADGLRAAGLDRVTVSLDTLRRRAIPAPVALARSRRRARRHRRRRARVRHGQARYGRHPRRERRRAAGAVEYAGRVGAEIRFIEYMDVGGATRLVRRRGSCRAPRSSRARRARSARSTPIGRAASRAGHALSRCRRADVRHHRLDHRSRSAATAIGPG